MARLAAYVVALGALAAASLAPAHAEKRVAFVIGNSAYEFVANLANPRNDPAVWLNCWSNSASTSPLPLTSLLLEMRLALRDFGRETRGADIAAVYYAGHGIEIDKRNYLIPVDASLVTDQDVNFEAIALDDVLRALERADGLQMVILEACRENPFAANMERAGATCSIGRGLARIVSLRAHRFSSPMQRARVRWRT